MHTNINETKVFLVALKWWSVASNLLIYSTHTIYMYIYTHVTNKKINPFENSWQINMNGFSRNRKWTFAEIGCPSINLTWPNWVLLRSVDKFPKKEVRATRLIVERLLYKAFHLLHCFVPGSYNMFLVMLYFCVSNTDKYMYYVHCTDHPDFTHHSY